MKIFKFFFLASILVLVGCDSVSDNDVLADISIQWELKSNTLQNGRSSVVFSFTNMSTSNIEDSEWILYYNQANVLPSKQQKEQSLNVTHINGDWYKLTPTNDFKIASGKTVEFIFHFDGPFIKMSDVPMGLYFVRNDGTAEETILEPTSYNVLPFTRPEQIHREKKDYVHIPTAETRFNENNLIEEVSAENVFKIIPSPYSIQVKSKDLQIDNKLVVSFETELKSEALYLQEALKTYTSIEVVLEQTSNANLYLELGSVAVNGVKEEAYSLDIDDKNIRISGSDSAGVFYGIQSFLALQTIQPEKKSMNVSQVQVKDAPRFGYRGLQLDVSRNFQSKESVKKVIDLLATYKVNTLLIYLTEDEGWRIEIEDLPELTQIGSQRKHTSMESAALHPAYGSGPFSDSDGNHSKGYYSKADFLEILRYAKQRHVMVIPEVNLPGHARAAIKSMEYRYERLMKEGKPEEAEKYRLIDPDDTSEYLSAQSFKDNVVCVCRESVYTFYEKVIDEIIEMYEEVDAPLEYFHTGGDEVPKGPWTKSPICEELVAQLDEIDEPGQLHTYFFRKTVEILNKRNLKIAGWEEATLKTENGNLVVNPEFANQNVIPYAWNNLWGAQDLGYQFANRGYQVVLCPVTNFYFDLAYDKDPEEPGLYWAGFVDSKNSYEFAPFDVFKTTSRNDAMSTPFDSDKAYAGMEQLSESGKKNILGIQAQLWSETVKGADMMEYYLLPKLFGFAESAWAKERVWETIEDPKERANAVQKGWSGFVQSIGQNELQRLDVLAGGYGYRIPKPGAVVENGMLQANTRYSNLQIRYTTDGSEPTLDSPIYTSPMKVNGEVRLKAFTNTGRASKTTITNSKPTKIKT